MAQICRKQQIVNQCQPILSQSDHKQTCIACGCNIKAHNPLWRQTSLAASVGGGNGYFSSKYTCIDCHTLEVKA